MFNLFSSSISRIPAGVGALRIGTDSVINPLDQVSNLYTVTANSQATAFTSRMYVNGNTAITVAMAANRFELYRQITSNTTDTNVMVGCNPQIFINVANGQVYTNSSANGVSAIRVANLSLDSSTGTLAITTYHGIYVLADSTTNTGRKTALRLGAPTNGSVGNAFIADNVAYSGSYFINSTSTSTSLFTGKLQTAAANESTGAGSAALSTNCPAVTASAPYTWIAMLTSDSSVVYYPVWK